MKRPGWAPIEVDMASPSVARVYDYYLGGSHNFASDRAFAGQVMAVLPEMARVAQENRAFLRRAVRYLCAQGVDQFLDLGSGIPTVGNVHEVAAGASPSSRVVYVDHDPVAVLHSRALLADTDRAVVVQADLTDATEVLADPTVQGHLDRSRPMAALLISVLHFVGDEQDPGAILRRYVEALAPGSFVVISHATAEGAPQAADAQAVYNQAVSPNPMRMRSAGEVRRILGDLPLVEPGLVRIPLWRPETPVEPGTGPVDYPGFAVVARVA